MCQHEWRLGCNGTAHQQHGLAEKMTECRRMCKAIAVNTEARLQATLDMAPCARQLATDGGRGQPAEKCPVTGEMHSKTQLLQRLRKTRAAAAVKVKTARERLGVLFVKDAQTAKCDAGVRPRVRRTAG